MPKIFDFKPKVIVLAFLIVALMLPKAILAIESNEEEDYYVAVKAFDDGFYDLSLNTFDSFIKHYPNSKYLAQAQFFVGRCLFYQSDFLKALSQFQPLLSDPRAASFKDGLYYWIAEVHFKGNDYQTAALFYGKVIDNYPKSDFNPQALYSLGRCQLELEKFETAIKSFSRLITEFPNQPIVQSATFDIGETYYRAKEYEKAKEAFKKFISNFPKSSRISECYYFLGEISYYSNDYPEALSLYHRALNLIETDNNLKDKSEELKGLINSGIGWAFIKEQKLDEAAGVFFSAKESDSVLLGRAAVKLTRGDPDDAIRIYDALINKYPASPYLLDAFLGKAEALYKRDSFEESAEVYSKIIKDFSGIKKYKDVENKIHYGLAWALLKSGQFQGAIKEFEKIAKASSDDIIKISALCQMGDTYQETREFNKAIDVYDRILKEYPDSLYSDYVQFQLAVNLYKLERLDASILAFQAVLENYPKTKLRNKVEYYLGLIYFQQSNFKASQEKFSQFLKERKEVSLKGDALYLLASSYYNLGEYKQSLLVFERIFKENVKKNEKLSQAAEYEIANCLYQLGREKEALQRFKIFLKKHPESKTCADIIYWMGEFYSSKENYETARRYFRLLLNDYPDSELSDSAVYSIGVTYLQSDRLKAALKTFSQLLNSKNLQLGFNSALSMADIYIAGKDFNTALDIYNKLINDNRFAQYRQVALIKKADTLRLMRNYKESLAAYKQALNNKYDSQILFKMGELSEEMGDLDSALDNYLKLSYLPGLDQTLAKRALLRAARICEARNNWQEAAKIYNKLIDSKFEEAEYAKDRLDWIEKHIFKPKTK